MDKFRREAEKVEERLLHDDKTWNAIKSMQKSYLLNVGKMAGKITEQGERNAKLNAAVPLNQDDC